MKFNDLKVQQLQKEQCGLATNGLKTELQSQLIEAREAKNINVEKYIFQLELEEETTKKKEARSLNAMDINMILAAMSQMSAQMS